MRNIIKIMGGCALALAFANQATAGSFEESMGKCLTKNANTRDSAVVMLECTADGGKLTECKVLENSAPNKGFDKAALCVADALPMGSKTGTVKVPMRFPGGG
ncbi:energy transducer TonB family protein [Phenylobacterium aquaticum]|uniref:energy transducer TonB family protein n=1 Tax=Phenylobacterium aquaticum TaxID=1763816 RepID=UPI001F5DE7BB|nr:energy transducer TonB [Phenylobacterium aquaticum]MCI3132964.1 energy transducer TonB [Phenylobacterium aquaticum]